MVNYYSVLYKFLSPNLNDFIHYFFIDLIMVLSDKKSTKAIASKHSHKYIKLTGQYDVAND